MEQQQRNSVGQILTSFQPTCTSTPRPNNSQKSQPPPPHKTLPLQEYLKDWQPGTDVAKYQVPKGFISSRAGLRL